MAKARTVYFCQNCGHQSPKWLGKCPSCAEWNTFVEEVVQKEDKADKGSWRPAGTVKAAPRPRSLTDITYTEEHRALTHDRELNRVLGGGIVPGSLVLIGGEPGIGKSTLMLQIATGLPMRVLYVSGEESEQQIKMRAERLAAPPASPTPNPSPKGRGEKSPSPFGGRDGGDSPFGGRGAVFILTETNTQRIFSQIEELEPDILIIDSIQTLHSTHIESGAGSVSQVRECAAELLKYAKESGVPVFMIGHITKEGTLAGPKVLEHMVDTVLQFEGDRHLAYRILRTTKNRFGSTSELGIYEMIGNGLREVSNPSEILISQRDEELSGITIGAMLEGNRPLLIEIQSLVSPATYGTPQRSTTGYDTKRVQMLLAVLEKRGGFKLGTQDVFLNIAGGLKVEDPAIDLAVCASIVSSYEDITVSPKIAFAAEVGLGGEVRAVNRLENRVAEAAKLGFREIYVSKYNLKGLNVDNFDIHIHAVARLDDLFERLFR